MSKIDYQTVEQYQKLLETDPKSKAFAVLAEYYREMGMIDKADTLLKRGISFHPKYAPGYVVLGHVYLQTKKFDSALKLLSQAIELSPDNLLAHQLLGETYLLMKRPKEALKAHKMAMFLNPQSTRSKQVVKKLESLEAEEYENDIFEMKPISSVVTKQQENLTENVPKQVPQVEYSLDRGLSFVDALIVRHNTPLARQKLIDLKNRFPENKEIETRWKMLSEDQIEEAEPIKPLVSREKHILETKIHKLQNILAVLEAKN
jgi:tetratricopeptide (TPR) repeat protein